MVCAASARSLFRRMRNQRHTHTTPHAIIKEKLFLLYLKAVNSAQCTLTDATITNTISRASSIQCTLYVWIPHRRLVALNNISLVRGSSSQTRPTTKVTEIKQKKRQQQQQQQKSGARTEKRERKKNWFITKRKKCDNENGKRTKRRLYIVLHLMRESQLEMWCNRVAG